MPVADSGTLSAVAPWRRAVLGVHRSLEPRTPREFAAGHRTIRADAGLRTSVLEFGGRPICERFVAAAVYGGSVAACRIAYRTGAGCSGAPNPARKCLELSAILDIHDVGVAIRRQRCRRIGLRHSVGSQ